MARFVWTGVALQLASVAAGHFVEGVLNLSGVLGTGISFGVAVAYGLIAAETFGQASRGGLVIGLVGSLAGVCTAMLLGDTTWMTLTYAPFASAATGWLGAVVGRVGRGAPAAG
jgi:hypothetical protein